MIPGTRPPRRGEIWFAKFPTDPPDKGYRPAVVVSTDIRNQHPRILTVLVVPLTTSTHVESPMQIHLAAAETGLAEDSAARADAIAVIRKTGLAEPRHPLRRLSHSRVCELARCVVLAMGCG